MNIKQQNLERDYEQNYTLKTTLLDRDFLTKKSIRVDVINDKIRTLSDNMFYSMVSYGGLGLAAPQVGELVRMFVLSTRNSPFINPEFLHKSGSMIRSIESCLSIPNYSISVPRHKSVTLEWYDLAGTYHLEKFNGKIAITIQHEMDHLDGLLIDRFEK